MFSEIAEKFEGKKFLRFQPYADCSDRDAYTSLDAEWKLQSVKLAEGFADYSFPGMLATDFLEFSRTGNRGHYEDKFFQKRHALNAFILAECIEDKGRFLDQIINGVFSICEESAWQLPPHNSYEGTPNFPLPDSTEPVLDLFSCETGAILACARYLMKAKLDGISPFIAKRILAELDHRIYTPYLSRHFWWMGNGKDKMCNWTIWCTQNVLLSAFLNECLDEEIAGKIFLKACRSVDYFLADYGEDGCCDEGAQYYRHAGLCLFNTMEILNAVTGGAFLELYQNEKIKNIAEYIFNVHIHDQYFVNFADCSPVAGRAGVREFLFAERIGNPSMQAFAAADFAAGGSETLLLPVENNLFYRLQNGFTVTEIRKFFTDHCMFLSKHASESRLPAEPGRISEQTYVSPIPHKDIYYPSIGLFLVRDSSLFLAVKAGNNGDSHNHNDTGSFTVYKDGQPFFIDLGVESYTQKTFSDRRYEIWTMQSSYHNLPEINGLQQKDGAQYTARVISFDLNSENPYIEMDIAGAYPFPSYFASAEFYGSNDGNNERLNTSENEGIAKLPLRYIRKATLRKGKEIVIEDNITPFQVPVVLNLMTYEKPVLKSEADMGGDASAHKLTIGVGTLGILSVSGASLIRIEEIPVTDPRLMNAWKHEVYRIQLSAVSGTVSMHIM